MIWFAKDANYAIEYAKNANEKEGYKLFNVDTVRLADEQLKHIDNWQTWTDREF